MYVKKVAQSTLCLALVCIMLLACGATTQATDTPPVELSLYTYWIPATSIQRYEEVAGLMELEKLANVHITWRTPSAGQNEMEAFNIMLASGDYPDIIQHRWSDYPGGLQKLVTDGVIQVLDPYFNEGKAPDYKAILDSNEELWRQVSLSDGSIARFSTIEVLKRAAYEGIILRKDWLDKVGMEVPTTVDEFYAVLKAFKEADPNIIPYTASKPVMMGIKRLIAPWGVIMDMCLDEAGQVVYGPAEPGYKDAMATLSKWYAEGLIDSECFSIDEATVNAKMTSGEAVGTSGAVSAMTNYITYGRADNPDFDFVPVPFLKNGENGKPYVDNRERVMQSGRRGAAISTTCSNVDAALNYLNSYYAPETRDYAIWGIEGESYTIDADGSKHYTDIIKHDPDGLPMPQALNRFAIPLWGWFKEFDLEAAYECDMNTPLTVAANELWWQGDMSLILPVMQLPPEDALEYAELMSEILTFVEESTVNFIIGTKSMDEYDSYLGTLSSMNVARAVEIQQRAYDTFQTKSR